MTTKNLSWSSAAQKFSAILPGLNQSPPSQAWQGLDVKGWARSERKQMPPGIAQEGHYLLWTGALPPSAAPTLPQVTPSEAVRWELSGGTWASAKGFPYVEHRRLQTSPAQFIARQYRLKSQEGGWYGLAIYEGGKPQSSEEGDTEMEEHTELDELDEGGAQSDDEFGRVALAVSANASRTPPMVVLSDLHVAGTLFAQSITARSDETHKRDLKPLQEALFDFPTRYNALMPLAYDLGDQNSYGFSAQEVQKIFPNVVRQAPDGSGLFVDYNALHAFHVWMIKTMLMSLDAVKTDVATLHKQSPEWSRVLASFAEGFRSSPIASSRIQSIAAELAVKLGEDPSKAKNLVEIINKVDDLDVINQWAKASSGPKFFKEWKLWQASQNRFSGLGPPGDLRSYQQDIVDQVFEDPSRPALIVMPTGAGKTLVAAHVLMRLVPPTSPPGSGIGLFVVRDRALVLQQQWALRSAANSGGKPKWIVAAAFGGVAFVNDESVGSISPELFPSLVSQSHVVVITSGFLELCADKLDWQLVRAVVFDEVHNAKGSHPYAKVLGRVERLASRPVVLGLTATPGAKNSMAATLRAIDQLKTLLGGVDTRTLVVQAIDPRLTGLFALPGIERVDVAPPSDEMEALIGALADLARELREQLETELDRRSKSAQFKDTPRVAPVGDDDEIQINLVNWAARVQRDCDAFEDQPRVPGMYGAAWLLQKVAMAVVVLPDVDLREARNFMFEIAGEAVRHGLDDSRLCEVVSRFDWNAMIENQPGESAKLQALLSELDAKKHAPFKAIIRVEMRYSARWLLRVLSNPRFEGAYQPRLLLGRGTRVADTAFSAKQMRESLDAFKGTEANVLISTSVVQEGVDVPSCNLVVCFNAQSASTGQDFVQLSGRARAQDSRFVVLAAGFRDKLGFDRAGLQARNAREAMGGGA